MPRIELTRQAAPTEWALRQRHLLRCLPRAARHYLDRYTRADGTLLWREEWPGMDGSDDAYEAFFNLPLLASLCGDLDLDQRVRDIWEAVTRQFTEFGQVHREYDGYYDWMHHGESNLLLYSFALSDPSDPKMRARSLRFIRMYTGDDPLAPNYDRDLRMMRSPINGSRGPWFENTIEDWETHLEVLSAYHPPYNDIPSVIRENWTTRDSFSKVVAVMNERMMRGDVPLNLTATALGAHAFMLTGDQGLVDWATSYTAAWMERADANGGLLPDNIGPTGRIGECLDGRWWGGYYGWQWPHGLLTVVEPAVIAAASTFLMTGDRRWLELSRGQLEQLDKLARVSDDGGVEVPSRYDENGWDVWQPAPVEFAVTLWHLSQQEDDAERVRRWAGPHPTKLFSRGGQDNRHFHPWFEYVNGRNSGYPVAVLAANQQRTNERLARIRADEQDPHTVDIHHFQDLNPVTLEGLIQLTMGGPSVVYHGGLLHTSLRHFDATARRPGLPPDVAVLVRRVDSEGVDVEVLNLDPVHERELVLQGGAFAEHTITGIVHDGREEAVGGTSLSVGLAPGAGAVLRLALARNSRTPSYQWPV
jgi:hypothetical protein